MNPYGKFFYIIIELSKIQNSTASSYIYIYICFYLCRLHRETIEKQDVLSVVSCSLREMERVTAMNRYFIKRRNEPKNKRSNK